jgi:alpha-ketoglutarate-dependent taurine dioxygenase
MSWDEARARLQREGWLYLPQFQPEDDGGASMLAFARTLGRLYVFRGADPNRPVVETRPRGSAGYDEPFDQLPALGWHNDFSTHRYRPRWSLSYIRQEDAAGGGNWRVADVKAVLARLRATGGRDVTRQLREPLPFSFTGEGVPCWFRGLTRNGLRFYGRTMRDGARLAHGEVPERVERAIGAVERAADVVGSTVRATTGALLILDNRRVLHDRLEQGHDARKASLAFVLPSVDDRT